MNTPCNPSIYLGATHLSFSRLMQEPVQRLAKEARQGLDKKAAAIQVKCPINCRVVDPRHVSDIPKNFMLIDALGLDSTTQLGPLRVPCTSSSSSSSSAAVASSSTPVAVYTASSPTTPVRSSSSSYASAFLTTHSGVSRSSAEAQQHRPGTAYWQR
jgi:hypothetical protein